MHETVKATFSLKLTINIKIERKLSWTVYLIDYSTILCKSRSNMAVKHLFSCTILMSEMIFPWLENVVSFKSVHIWNDNPS